MALPNVTTTVGNGGLGTALQTDDGVVAMLLGSNNGAPAGLEFMTPQQIYSADDIAELGITEEWDEYVFRTIEQFFTEIGGSGRLNIAIYDSTVFAKSEILVDDVAVSLLNSDKDISLLGVAGAPAEVPAVIEGIDPDCYLALNAGQILGDARAVEQYPIRVVIEANDYNDTPADLQDLTAMEYDRCELFMGSASNDRRADIALMLGRLASVGVQRKASRVRDGALNITEGFNGVKLAEDFNDAELEAMDAKGYNMLRVFATKAGYYISNDRMATSTSSDYALMARGRIMDKAQKIAYATFLEWVNDEIAVDTDGNIEPGVAATMESEITQQLDITMTANSEISSCRAEVPTDQNVLSTDKIQVKVYIVPVGYASEIEVFLNFENPAV